MTQNEKWDSEYFLSLNNMPTTTPPEEFIKHLRISIASIFLYIWHKIDARDIFDLQAEIDRAWPRVGECSSDNL